MESLRSSSDAALSEELSLLSALSFVSASAVSVSLEDESLFEEELPQPTMRVATIQAVNRVASIFFFITITS